MKTTVIMKNGRPVHTTKASETDHLASTLFTAIGKKDAQIQALTERNEFLEDLVAELAVQVYTTPPSA